jgi:rhodanese-related sulfurtransferase
MAAFSLSLLNNTQFYYISFLYWLYAAIQQSKTIQTMKIQIIAFTLVMALLSMGCAQTTTEGETAPATTSETAAPEKEKPQASFQNISAADFKSFMAEHPDAVVLDVRTEPEINQGIVPGAQHFDVKLPNFAQEIQALDKDKDYLVYCRSGRRSVAACKIMADQGFTKLFNMEGGYMEWVKKNVE